MACLQCMGKPGKQLEEKNNDNTKKMDNLLIDACDADKKDIMDEEML